MPSSLNRLSKWGANRPHADHGQQDHRQRSGRGCDSKDHRLQKSRLRQSIGKEHHMSLTLIAMTGILVGFLCLIIGFFMEDTKDTRVIDITKEKRMKPLRKKMVVPRRKAA